MVRHWIAVAALVGLGVANMWGWLDPDRLPPYDFPGYVTVVEDVRDQILHHGGVPRWTEKWFSGTTQFMSHFKERLIFPLALAFDPLRGTQLAVFLFRLAAGLVIYLAFGRYFGARGVGLACGFAYAFGVTSSYSSENVDVMLSYLLFPLIFIAAVEMFRRQSVVAAVALGVLIACEFSTNLIHALVTPFMVLLIGLFRPWVRDPDDADARPDRRRLSRWGGLVALALAVFGLFSASQIAWFALDQRHHAPHSIEHVERAIRVFAEQSPFTLINRANWLGGWLEEHRTPYQDLFRDDPMRNQRHYLGVVAMVICALGWFRARSDRVLRRLIQIFALLFLLQWNLAMGPHSLVWELARSFRVNPNFDPILLTGIRVAAGVCAVTALLLWRKRSWRLVPGVELWLGLGLLLACVATPLFAGLRELVSFFAHFRSPGKFMNLLPFAFAGLFGVSLLAITRSLAREEARRWFPLLVLALLVVDLWPGRAAFYRGHSIAAVREFREIVAELPAGEDAGRIALYLFDPPTWWVESSMVTVRSPVNGAWGWLPWQATWFAQPYLEDSFRWLEEDFEPEKNPGFREMGSVLSRIGRFRYLLDEFRGERTRELDGAWSLRASNQQFALWEQPWVLPKAYGYRGYVLTVGDNYRPAAMTIYRAHKRGMAVLAGGESFDQLPAPLAEGAALVVGISEGALSESDLGGNPALARGLEGRLLAPGVENFNRRFSEFFAGREVHELVSVDTVRLAPDHLRLTLDAGTEPAVIFVSEAYHPWWCATVDGRSTPVTRAHMMFMALRVGPGRHEIDLRLTPPLAIRAADTATALAWLALAGTGAGFAVHQLRRRTSD